MIGGRRRAVTAAIAAAATASVLGPSAGASPGAPRLLVTGREYDLTLSRAKIDPGHATIQFSNGGEDPHNLRIKRAGTTGNGHGAGKTAPGGLAQFTAHLRPGSRYVLWCSLSNHRALGMVAHLNARG